MEYIQVHSAIPDRYLVDTPLIEIKSNKTQGIVDAFLLQRNEAKLSNERMKAAREVNAPAAE